MRKFWPFAGHFGFFRPPRSLGKISSQSLGPGHYKDFLAEYTPMLYEEEEEEEEEEERDNLSVAGCGEHEQVCSKIGHQSLTLYSVFSSFFKPVVLSCLWLRRMNKFKTECLSVITEHKI